MSEEIVIAEEKATKITLEESKNEEWVNIIEYMEEEEVKRISLRKEEWKKLKDTDIY